MRLNRFTALILSWVAFASLAQAQMDKVEVAAEEANYKRVIKLTADYMEDRDLKKIPEVYLYHALGQLELSKDEYYFEKNPDAMKLAVKAAFKARKRDKDTSVTPAWGELYDNLALRQNEIAEGFYNINKMSKALKLYDQSFELNGNRTARLMTAKCALSMEDSIATDTIYAELIALYNEDLATNAEDAEQSLDPHIYFINKQWEASKYDSARYFLSNARSIFGDDVKLNFYHKEITLDQIKDMPPSHTVLAMVQEALIFSPFDNDLLHKENALYIYLIKHHYTHNMPAEADSMMAKFVAEKVTRSSHPKAYRMKVTDVFIEEKQENVIWKLSEYFQTYQHLATAEHVLEKYIRITAKDSTEEALERRWGVIAQFAYGSKPLQFSSFILAKALERYPESEELLALRLKIISEREVVKSTVEEQGAIYGLMQAIYAADPSAENRERIVAINDKYVGLLIAANRFSTVQDVMAEQMQYAPDGNYEERLKFIAKEDFYHNYFMTKTKGKNDEGEVVDLFEWNGSISGCDPGEIDLNLQEKVANRINYFRRNAGVPEVFFDAATNEYCQQAALMMTANRALEHDPPRTWRCFTDEGAYAAKHSLLIKDAHTSMAVTYIMDDKNPTAGNRRWLLYPNGKIYGHGSSENVAVIWALDDSGTTDSSQFIEQPVCWPPNGYVPQMMLFENWTFGLYQDLDSATVTVKQDGNAIDVKLEKFVEGYGSPTLVFKPQFDKLSLPEESTFEVTVTLSSGSQYSYVVRTFRYDPNRI